MRDVIAPDMSRSGYQRRLGALRAAARYRNPETGRGLAIHFYGDKRATLDEFDWGARTLNEHRIVDFPIGYDE